ncbi:protein kinase protein [Trichomonas vaginalis G3]|uniref:protein kinase protein n=1 Tax=Trichomonas vaginalis (strain ATCC PRA-98 / G3) TaxID=412133 RepID=UPI0021E58521|nr:protein kinase protein [Trichomonas vaginalis G3]KAI5539558.1 protein kinase protein [Trichomonas vaginalis G3]
MNDFIYSKVTGICSRISVLQQHEMTTFVHCSKFNSLIQAFKDLIPYLEKFIQENTNTFNGSTMKHFSNIENVVDELIQLTIQSSHDSFVRFVLASSTLEVFDQFFSIRDTTIKSLKALGMNQAASIFELTPDRLISQDQVDLKHIATIIQQIETDYDLNQRQDISDAIKARYISLQRKNIRTAETANNFVNIPALPDSVDLVIKHEQIQYEKEIGHGYSGRVYEGYIVGRPEKVAIKVLNGSDTNGAMRRSLRTEITTLSTLSHPSILKLLGYTLKSPFCLIIELLQNGSLADFLKNRPNELTPTDKTLITIDVARGMHYIHEKMLIHRDLKSFNILLDSNKRARICDFGFVRVDSFEPSTGMIGTPQWMAPEVMMCSPMYDNKVDVYSFGIVLWEMLTNQPPYAGIPVQRLPTLIVKNEYRPEIPEGTPPALAGLIKDCWSSDPTKRPSFAEILTKLYDPAFHYPGTDEEKLWSLTSKDCNFVTHSLSISKLAVNLHKIDDETEAQQSLVELKELLKEDISPTYKAIWRVEKMASVALRIITSCPDILVEYGTFLKSLISYMANVPSNCLHLLLCLIHEYLLSDTEKTKVEYQESGASKFIEEMMNNEQDSVASEALSIFSMQLTEDSINKELFMKVTSFCKGMKAPLNIREKAVDTIIMMYEKKPDFAINSPNFLFHLLSFGIFTPKVLDVALKLSEQVKSCVPTSTITQLLIAYDNSQRNSNLTVITKCITKLLTRFEILRSTICLDSLLRLSEDFPLTAPFFSEFAQYSKETGESLFTRDIITALFQSVKTNPKCIDAITRFAATTPQLVTSHLPVDSKDTSRVLKLYTQIPEACTNQKQAYEAIKDSIGGPDEAIACTLLRSFELSDHLIRETNLHNTIIQRVVSIPLDESGVQKLGENVLPALLEMVCCLKTNFNEYSECVPVLKHLMKGNYKCAGLATEVIRTFQIYSQSGAMSASLFSKNAKRHSSTQPTPVMVRSLSVSGPRRRSQDDPLTDT